MGWGAVIAVPQPCSFAPDNGMIEYSYIAHSGLDSPRNDTASIVELADNRFIAVWHKYKPGPEGVSDFGMATIAAKFSDDGGRTWKDEHILVDIEPGDVNVQAPALCLLPSGELLMICLRAHARDSSSMLLLRSMDNGKTFHLATKIWERSKGQWLQGGASQLLLLNNGRLLLPFHGGAGDQGSQHNIIRCFYSDNLGESWQITPAVIDLPMRGAMEASVAEPEKGMLVMSIRTQLGAVFLSLSYDGGFTWTLPQTSGLKAPESCTCLRCIPGTSTLVLLWNDSLYDPSHHHYGIRTPLSAAVSKDFGTNWNKLGDIDGGDVMLTNIGCTFTSRKNALITYLHVDDAEVSSGKFIPIDQPGWGPSSTSKHRGLKCALVDTNWFLKFG